MAAADRQRLDLELGSRTVAYKAAVASHLLLPAEMSLVHQSLRLEVMMLMCSTEFDMQTMQNYAETLCLGEESIEPFQEPPASPAKEGIVPARPSTIMVNPVGSGPFWLQAPRQVCEACAVALSLQFPSARVTVDTFMLEDRLLPRVQVQCFRLAQLSEVAHSLPDFAMAGIVDIMSGMEAADRQWQQNLQGTVSQEDQLCRMYDCKRLAYRRHLEAESLMGIVHIRRLPGQHPLGNIAQASPSGPAASGREASHVSGHHTDQGAFVQPEAADTGDILHHSPAPSQSGSANLTSYSCPVVVYHTSLKDSKANIAAMPDLYLCSWSVPVYVTVISDDTSHPKHLLIFP